MSLANIPFKLTVAGQDAAFNLGAIDLNVTYVQLGSGNRTPNGNETALVAPQEYSVISGHFEVSAGQHRIAAIIAGSASVYQVSEIGLWSGVPGDVGSVLVFYWALPASYIAIKSASIDFNFESDIFFGGVVPGNITIVVDTEFNSLAMIAAHEADPDAHHAFTTPPLWDNDGSPATTEFVQQTVSGLLTKSVAGAVDVTLTDIEAGHGVLRFTGAITSNINVIVPVSHAFRWLVENNTTGAFSVTVKTATGTGEIAIRGAINQLWSDGVNVVNAATGVIQSGVPVSAVAGGTADALTAAFKPVITAISNQTLLIRAAYANATTTPTLAVDGLSAITIVKGNNLPLALGDMAGAGHWAEIKLDATLGKAVLLNPANGVFSLPTGTIIQFAGSTPPAGYLTCPLSVTNVSRVTYAALFAVIGTTWGSGDGSTTFGIPYFPADYAVVQANANVGTSTVGVVLSHTHTVPVRNLGPNTPSGTPNWGNCDSSNTTTNSQSPAGGAANLAAGMRSLFCVKY